MKIVTLTMNPSIDMSASIDRVVPNQKLRCSAPEYEPGGGGVNVSRAIRHLEQESLAVFPHNGDACGRLSQMLEREDVKYETIPIRNPTRRNLTVVESKTEQQYRFVFPGPEFSEKEWNACLDRVSGFDPAPEYLIASGSLPPGVPSDFYARLSRAARQQGIKPVIDTKGEALKRVMEEGACFIKPNMRELGQLVGEDFDQYEHLEQAALDLVREGKFEFIVISLGAGGAVLVTDEKASRFHAPVVPIQNRVGAGDSMMAGIVLGLMSGWSQEESVLYGIAAGSAAVMTPGSQLCRKEDTEKLFQKIKEEQA